MIEVLCIRHEKPAELLLMKNEKVIETFSPYASQIAFARRESDTAFEGP